MLLIEKGLIKRFSDQEWNLIEHISQRLFLSMNIISNVNELQKRCRIEIRKHLL